LQHLVSARESVIRIILTHDKKYEPSTLAPRVITIEDSLRIWVLRRAGQAIDIICNKVDRTSMRPRRGDRMPHQIDKLIQMWGQGFNLDTRSGKKLWNSCLRLTSQIHPCLFRLMGSNTCTYTCRERSKAAGTCMVGLKNVMRYIIRIRCNLSRA